MVHRPSVCLVAHAVHPLRIGGAEIYARNLIDQLPLMDQEIYFTIVLAKGHDFEPKSENVKIVEMNVPITRPYIRVLWEHSFLSWFLNRNKFDLVHFPSSTASFGYFRESIVTIHETLRFQAPDSTPNAIGWYYGVNQTSIVRRKFDVISVSQHDSQVIQQRLGVDSKRLHVIPLGGSERFSDLKDSKDAKDLYWVGAPYQHKCVPLLIQAFSIAESKLPSEAILHLVGITNSFMAELQSISEQFGIGHKINMHPPMDTESLKNIIQTSGVLCFPSSYESFGIPVLEALSCGRSVACGNLEVFDELFGGHIHRSAEQTPSAFADAIVAAFNEFQSGKHRQSHRSFATGYTWANCARQTLDAYRSTSLIARLKE